MCGGLCQPTLLGCGPTDQVVDFNRYALNQLDRLKFNQLIGCCPTNQLVDFNRYTLNQLISLMFQPICNKHVGRRHIVAQEGFASFKIPSFFISEVVCHSALLETFDI